MGKTTFTYNNRSRGFGLVGCLALSLFLPRPTEAQTLPLVRQQGEVVSYYNPAAMAPRGIGLITALAGRESQRNTYYLLQAELPFEYRDRVYAAGGQYLHAQQDLWEWNSISLRSALRLPLSLTQDIHIGIEGALHRLTFDGTKALKEGITNDELPSTKSEGKALNLGLGIQYYGTHLSLGFAASNILPNQFHMGARYTTRISPRYAASMSYMIGSQSAWAFIPSLWGLYEGFSSWQANLRGTLWYRHRIALGGTYRWQEAYGLQVQVCFERFSLGYQLEHTYRRNQRLHQELFLSYTLPTQQAKQTTPRYKSIRLL